jgi:aspartate/methionine/tyrosine aminotransferase
MLPRVEYLSWATETFPHAKWDLATSGLPSISAADLGLPSTLSDPAAPRLFAAKISARYGVPAEEVVPTLGTSGALWTLAAALLPASGEPCEVLIETPTYEPLLRVIEGFGARVRRVPRLAGEGYRLDPKRLAAALTGRTRLVVVASPHNPTGVVTPDSDLAEIAASCAARGAYLLVDEVYRELVLPGTTARSLGPNVLAASSLTKCFGLGWARAGWALLPGSLRDGARAAEIHAAGVLPTTCGAIGAHALDRLDVLEARARSLAEGRRGLVDAFLAKHSVLSWTPPPPRALFGFVHADQIDVESAATRARTEHGLIVVPGSYFGEPSGFRLSWASLPPERLGPALELLGRALGLPA